MSALIAENNTNFPKNFLNQINRVINLHVHFESVLRKIT